ncbi:hypothetical protein M422DRAFT_253613 [Sphaerobolus stellatus SS14]|uniref:Uncharacterized protein n=1 Tax=Sphaerobolus stellatus (strain SS14) TaxID=990650 RepID=A0A0C9VXF7_SPHS4|nr:hypothetical protein M422DRAFT_253613 [Sphaerobolus stellatus SS14]
MLPKLEQFTMYEHGGSVNDLFEFSFALHKHSFPVLSHINLEMDFPVVTAFLAESKLIERISTITITTNHAKPRKIHDFLHLCARRGQSLLDIMAQVLSTSFIHIILDF